MDPQRAPSPIDKDVGETGRRHLGPSTASGMMQFVVMLPTQRPDEDGNEVITVDVPMNSTVRSLWFMIWLKANQDSAKPSVYQLSNPDSYQLLYKKGASWYEIYDGQQLLHTLDSVKYWKCLGSKKCLLYVKQRAKARKEAGELWKCLTHLIGYDLQSIDANQHSEVAYARRKLGSARKTEMHSRNGWDYAMEPWLATCPLPSSLQSQISKELVVAISYNAVSHKMKAGIYDTADMVVRLCREKMVERGLLMDSAHDNLVLKVWGREEFITGNWPLIDFTWVRRCLKNKEELRLALVPSPCLADDEVKFEDWPLIDQCTGLTSTHDQLTLRGKDIEQIRMLSLWDCNQRFRVKVIGLDIPVLPSKSLPNVFVEGAVHHATNVLASARSQPMPLTEEILWNTWLEFDILVKNLPQGSRLSLSVYGLGQETSTTRDGKATSQNVKEGDAYRGKTKLFFFVNLLLIDHRSFLQQGEHILHMWAYSCQEDNLVTHEVDKLSSKTNPDIENSTAICILLDTYNYPVALPSGRGSRSSWVDQPEDEVVPVKQEVVQEKTQCSLSGSQRDLLKRFTEECARYSLSLPTFLSTVKWGDLKAVEEVHWLFDHWNPPELDIAIALELLSINIADEKVRTLSVQRLEEVDNGHLLRYLLQLVQALKFEPYHDSALARFLIRRALRAYLMGCGSAVIEGFRKQVQLVEALSQVATEIKKIIPEKSDLPPNAASMVQEMLRNADLPQDFLTPYDPRIRAGTILIDRCKIMASKKKPLWLEFSCESPDGSPCQPIGIIFKHGDDLRQDMLIIQTLVIMDSIWQKNALDLNLMPYGCIATGYNMGMIEIVRDAVTIATVQRSKGGNTGAFKNDALYDWMKCRLQVEESYYQAMETFVTSCAGYCVATYVLGIGDRHNDNIMITEQGNLFHIDFGHILGNTKRILGVNRERVPFVLTPDFLYVMGRVNRRSSLYFQRFKDICIQAYMSLRLHSNLLVTLFSLMMLTGIPELSCVKDIQYLKEALAVGKDEKTASEHFLSQINTCENLGWTVQANWWIHMFMGIKQT
ncbi:phosphatidylinositol 4,5-bisphosphate 3-kinase catalytic subunit gamma isoform isoform X2 [Stegostoma tigrinum]|uniref:phosphatidylinositol 4,5-bisphosphate 3-kinase catalytic subunit gamma isoform isoform X2 n=1 Tax=Stegostoma tigrinum TaxID=3053191 RepID=UPI0028703975|nr:phosphatidylinositol 4,5-bisphosphate 3-kinase catalytic subunit gamma isoform isoform X2 [Stegostoma tigrinum]